MRILLHFLFVSLLVMANPAHAEKLPITDFTLDNGLRVVLVEQHRAPAVAHMMLFHAGAADEPRGSSGVAHYLEHMLFKGTKELAEGDYSEKIEALGGKHNAFTSSDMTGYYVLVGKDNLAAVMEIEAERLINWDPEPSTWERERDVILEERRQRVENNPGALLSEAMQAALFRNHPYRLPIIGWMHEMKQLDEETAREFFNWFYQPENAVLMLVGDLSPEEAGTLARNYYADWENSGEVRDRTWLAEPPQRTEQELTLRHPQVKQRLWRIYYQAPSLVHGNTDQAIPLILLSELLGSDRTGLLYKELVKNQKLATALSVGYSGFALGPEIFSVSATPSETTSLEALQTAYEQTLQRIMAEDGPLEEKALNRVKNLVKADTIFSRDGLEGLTFTAAQLTMLGLDPSLLDDLPEAIDEVTLQEVRQAGRDVLLQQPSVRGILLPEKDNQHRGEASKKGNSDAS
jgi:zinc protease